MKIKGVLQQELVDLLNGTILSKRKVKKINDTLHINDLSLIEAAYKLAEKNPTKLLLVSMPNTYGYVLLTKIGA